MTQVVQHTTACTALTSMICYTGRSRTILDKPARVSGCLENPLASRHEELDKSMRSSEPMLSWKRTVSSGGTG